MDIRYITQADFPQVYKIYQEGMATQMATFETKMPNWEDWNAKYLDFSKLGLFEDGDLLGWVALSPVSTRFVYQGVAEVSIYISALHRSNGIGKLLLNKLIIESEKNGIWSLQASIFSINTASIHLHENCGFRTIGYKEKIGKLHGIWYNNIIMEKRSEIIGHSSVFETENQTTFQHTLDAILKLSTNLSPRPELIQLKDYILHKLLANQSISLNFICTHNSRRSQFSQIWAKIASEYFGILIIAYSGGVEETAFHPNAVRALELQGLKIIQKEIENPCYFVFYHAEKEPIICFSKLYDHPSNNEKPFAAIMVCDHADENCPFIPKADIRIPLRYEDPKAFDNTALQQEKYLERSLQIASEMFYLFSEVSKANPLQSPLF